jgi:hypothetical protein
MKKVSISVVSLVIVSVAFLVQSAPGRADEVLCKEVGGDFSASRKPVWGKIRLSCSYTFAEPHVNGWLRGWGKVDRSSGVVETVIELETDSFGKGPCGKADVELWGKGKQLAHIVMDGADPLCMAGRPPGKAEDYTKIYTIDRNVDPSIAAQTDEVRVATQVLGSQDGPWGWTPNLPDIINAIKIILAATG